MDAKARADCIKEIDLLKVKDLFFLKKTAVIIEVHHFFPQMYLKCPLLLT